MTGDAAVVASGVGLKWKGVDLMPNVAKLEAKGDVKGLTKALRHRRASVRQAAAKALGEIGDVHVVASLHTALGDEDSGVREAAAAALMEITGAQPGAPTAVSEPTTPNDALMALRFDVEKLTVGHPRRQNATLHSKLPVQLPWICRTLEEAASALESGIDPFGNPITDAQVCGGLRTLTEMVRDPEYLTLMEIGYPGIATPLERCMDRLEAIVGDIETPPTAVPLSSKGTETLVALCTELGILFPDQRVSQAVEELCEEGEPGSRSLAALIRELLACRSPKITYALQAAGQVVSVPELRDAVRAVASASELTEAPAHGRFVPHIVGGGRVGWASGTYRQVVNAALEATALLEDRG